MTHGGDKNGDAIAVTQILLTQAQHFLPSGYKIVKDEAVPSHELQRCEICGVQHGKVEDIDYDCPHQGAPLTDAQIQNRIDYPEAYPLNAAPSTGAGTNSDAPTPRTDPFHWGSGIPTREDYDCLWTVARQLERELVTSNQHLSEARGILRRQDAENDELRKESAASSTGTTREQALADALKAVLDDWANANMVGDDAREDAERALDAPVSSTAVPSYMPGLRLAQDILQKNGFEKSALAVGVQIRHLEAQPALDAPVSATGRTEAETLIALRMYLTGTHSLDTPSSLEERIALALGKINERLPI